MGVRMWASRDPSFFVFIFVVYFVSEMSDLLLGALGHCPFHHYVHSWCGFTPCLIWDWSLLLLVLFCSIIIVLVFASDSSFSLHLLFFSYSDPSRVWYSLCIIITHLIISSICFTCLIIDVIFTLDTLRSMAHGIFYTCCISYTRTWVYDHWVLEPSFPSFLSPYHPSLCYVPCL